VRLSADGRDVVHTRKEAARLPRPPLIILDALAEYLDEAGLGDGLIEWQRIGEGQSNVTYAIRRGTARFVVRRGPRPPLPRSTHDMVREARVQQFVGGFDVPVPAIMTVCTDENVLGVPFYVMEYLDGQVITDTIPLSLDPPDRRCATGIALVDLLLQLHRVPVDSAEARTLGRPDGYLRRQVERFSGLWEGNTERELPEVGQLGRWLAGNLPDSQAASVVHGDFRMGNVMFAPGASASILALLDWEMATLGDPLADLGYLVATYAEPGRPSSVMELTTATRAAGYATRAELIHRYRDDSELDLSALPWYETLALWKAAIFCEAIYTRWLRGERPDDTSFGPALATGVPQLLELAAQSAAALS
jgi:aminoglycoside phosphotransferase (APT) family kinase protein